MPYLFSVSRRFIPEVKSGHHFDRLISNFLDATYIAADANLQKLVQPGMVLARDATTNKYVPYSAGASYGSGSSTAVAMLDEYLDITMGEVAITPIWHGKLKEAFCYVYGSAMGTIPAAVKTALDDVEWV